MAEFIYGGVSSQKVGYIENLGAILGNCFCLQSVDQFYLRGTIGSLIIRLLFFFFFGVLIKAWAKAISWAVAQKELFGISALDLWRRWSFAEQFVLL